MKTKTLAWNEKDTLKLVTTSLKNNELILGTTDTVLGLFAATTEQGFLGLNKAKNRSEKPYLILISHSERIGFYTDMNEMLQLENIVKQFWPGPLTVIVKAKPSLPKHLVSQYGTVALRMPKNDAIQELLQQTGDLFSTSANKSNDPIPVTFKEVNSDLIDEVAYCVLGGQNSIIPSTILDCSEPGKIKIIREGAITKTQLGLD